MAALVLAQRLHHVITTTDENQLPAFPTSVSPIPVASYDSPQAKDLAAVIGQLRCAGFAVTSCPEPPTQERLLALAEALGLGEPFVPPLYRRAGAIGVAASGISTLTASAAHVAHPAVSASGQGLHVDGLLQPIGEVLTSILLCIRPAAEGGQSTLFNAMGAFWQLAKTDPDAAAALLSDRVLGRRATVNGSSDVTWGPAFAVVNGTLVTRYSRDGNDLWDPGNGQEAALGRALTTLQVLAEPDSPYALRFTLQAGQGLIMSNSRICHGRTPYRDVADRPRRMLRGLFLRDAS
ncbi:TauD/TfdA family dioxygenase [Nonomuraea sp. FMUSA5-5]|uniref:TauD/TfdA family dioxygenase n=1 Tax=Nonomuraea composti TaxID=2720023 RepID=A0ABX1BCB8_9ACTN|nr:TauD/TfdA family dioxygenase [Nonomuraea sp. FMUSA5-5]NJP95430.1 TauD/TfdA family dioxygenase [Nonomuraea sp. FMUSA5-5]